MRKGKGGNGEGEGCGVYVLFLLLTPTALRKQKRYTSTCLYFSCYLPQYIYIYIYPHLSKYVKNTNILISRQNVKVKDGYGGVDRYGCVALLPF